MTRRVKFGAWAVAGFMGFLLAGACGGGNYSAAGVGLGGMVAGAGVNRAITGDCWAACTPGYGCDRQRGTCVRLECAPTCSADEHCVLEADGRTRCIGNTGTLTLGAIARDAGTD